MRPVVESQLMATKNYPMKTRQHIVGSVLSLASVIALSGGCDTTEPDLDNHRILPLLAIDADGVQGLAGTYDTETNEIWLVDDTTSTTWELVQGLNIEQPEMVIFSQDPEAPDSYTWTFDETSTAHVGSLEVGEALRACVVADGQRWTISDLVIGYPKDMTDIAEFVPTALPVEPDRHPGQTCYYHAHSGMWYCDGY